MTATGEVAVAGSLAARRVIEALRAGVPSRAAVAALGSGQTAAEDAVTALLAAVAREMPAPGGGRGVLLGGGFGAGKSHLLEHLAALAGGEGWVVSRVVVSKETPLPDPAKVLRAMVDSATGPLGGPGQAVAEAAATLELDGREYAGLLRWAAYSLDERFATTLSVFARSRDRAEDRAEAIMRFWSGAPLKVTDIRRWCRELGEGRPQFTALPVRELARQRRRFLARLLAAAGATGWLVLFDEVELVARYGPIARARSYAELAEWLRPAEPDAPLAAVLAMTDDFEAAVLAPSGRADRTRLPETLRAKQTHDASELAGRAELGMRLVATAMLRLEPPDDAELDRTYATLRRLHGEAYGWDPPDVGGLERLGNTRMRQHVRAWINEWDLVRLDPDYVPATQVLPLAPDYREDADFFD